MDGSEDDVEDGEIHEGFLGQAEMENRKTLANAYGEDAQMSWVEAVLLGAKHVAPADSADAAAPDADNAERHNLGEEPPPPGTAADRPPPGAAAIARLEAALVHRITALLDGGGDTHGGGEGRHDAAGAVVEALAEAASDGVDVARWLGHGRSSLRGRTPLMEAARRNQTGCCARLAELACAHGAGLNAGNDMEGRNSALHYACYEGACGSVCELLVRGADPRLRNKEGETALQAALANGQTECADLVRDFLRRPTFEPDPQSGAILSAAAAAAEPPPPPPPPSPPSNAAVTPLRSVPSTRPSQGDKTVRDGDSGSGGVSGADRSGGGSNSSAGDSATAHGGSGGSGIGAAAIGGVTGVAPEVCRANAVFCLGRGRRRLGDRVRPGRGLGVGVGTAAAEVGLGARRVAQLHSTNPCSGTAMEAFVLWSIGSGQDPFQSESGEVGGGETAAGGGFDEEEGEHLRRKGRGRRWRRQRERGGGDSDGTPAGVVWLEHYVRVYNASLRRWYGQQESHHSSTQQLRGAEGYRATPAAAGEGLRRAPSGLEMGLTGGAAAAMVATGNSIGGGGGGDGGDGFGAGPPQEGSTYALVVKESKALTVGRRFEIPHGADLVIGRSQSLAGIVVKDELVSKSHLRIVNSDNACVRVSDLGSKHGAVITKPAPASSTGVPPPTGSTQPPLAGGKADGQPGAVGGRGGAAAARPAGLGGKDPPAAPKQKFFPIPIPRAPEWVAGAHGDRISLGKTVLVLEREGGPEPPATAAQRRRYLRQRPGGGVVEVAVDGSGGVGAGAGVVAAGAAARGKAAPAVISKGFAANPNLMNAIRTAEEAERRRKRAAAESELAAQAAAQYLSNKRARSAAASPAGSTAPPASAAGSRVGVAARVGSTASAAAAAGGAAPEVGVVAEDERQRESSSFDHVSKGSMLLRRMGWKEGTGLGRRSDGNLQPVQVERRGERAGLGTSQPSNNPFAVGADGRVSRWEQMRRRFSDTQSSGSGGFREAGRRASGAPGGVRWLKGKAEGGGVDESQK